MTVEKKWESDCYGCAPCNIKCSAASQKNVGATELAAARTVDEYCDDCD